MAYQLIKKGDIALIMKQLNEHQPIIVPTDTVWGIICFDEDPIYKLKQRDRNKKIVQFVKFSALNHQLNTLQQELIKTFWPGSLTIVFKNNAYRCPNNELLLKIINEVKRPLYCSSANLSGHPVITSASQAIEIFKTAMQDFGVYDVVSISSSLPSTIINIDDWTILRAGSIEQEIVAFLHHNHILSKS